MSKFWSDDFIKLKNCYEQTSVPDFQWTHQKKTIRMSISKVFMAPIRAEYGIILLIFRKGGLVTYLTS